ncbi:MAG: hypothetical protein C0418_01365 [Coriobacteriaceae bacterium]|nr:hypothetical protein [Coriobacteriaceae bacterium]
MSRISDYRPAGTAERRSMRLAQLADFGAGAVLAMLAFPFPIVRASVPMPVFITLVLAALVSGWWLYTALTAVGLGRTPGMYLFDLGFAQGRPGVRRAAVWAVTRSERLSGLRVVACDEPDVR